MKLRYFFAAACMAVAMQVVAQEPLKEFTLEDLNFGGKNYRAMTAETRYFEWWGDRLIHRESDECFVVDWQKVEGKKKKADAGVKETSLIKLADLNQWLEADGRKPLKSLYSITFPYPDQSVVMVKSGGQRLLVDFKAKKVVWSQAVENEQTATDWNAASKAVAYVNNHNLFVRTADGDEVQLTTDGSRDIVYGQSVHRNEFGIKGGTFWNPQGTRLAFYRMDQSMVPDYPLINVPEITEKAPLMTTPAPEKYPMAGEASHKVTVGVWDAATGQITYLQAGDPTDRYFTNVVWSPKGDVIYMRELNRDQNDQRLVSYNALTGEKLAELYRESSDTYNEPRTPIRFLPWDENQFLLQTDKDGFSHLYLLDIKAGATKVECKQLTSGNWEVLRVLGFSTSNRCVVIESNESCDIQSNIYSVNVETGQRTLLDATGKGWHNGSISGSGKFIVDFYAEPDVPRNIDLLSVEKPHAVRYFSAPNPWEGYAIPQYTHGTIKAADNVTDLHYRMVLPPDFDAQKQYPTVVYVYGGPHAHNVDARWHWGSRSWETYMAQRGYVLFILDNRGSEHRGRAFEQATFRQLGQVEMQDQMKGVEFLKTQAFVDTTRLGVHGWSFGGFMTISLMTTYPDVFKVGVAGGPVIDWKWYEVMYGERYMDTPESNPEGYKKTSLIHKAKNLKGRLQIIHGLNDPVVVPQHSYSFLKACIEAGTQPDFFVYPGEPHNMRGHQSVHLHERITRYFDDYLKPKQ